MIIDKYYSYAKYLKDKYGEKVYKVSINLPLTCPNRDGLVGTGGCIFCGEKGGGLRGLTPETTVKKQI